MKQDETYMYFQLLDTEHRITKKTFKVEYYRPYFKCWNQIYSTSRLDSTPEYREAIKMISRTKKLQRYISK